MQSQVSAQLHERQNRKEALDALHHQEDLASTQRAAVETLHKLEVSAPEDKRVNVCVRACVTTIVQMTCIRGLVTSQQGLLGPLVSKICVCGIEPYVLVTCRLCKLAITLSCFKADAYPDC